MKTKMLAEDKIRAALKSIMAKSEANACMVYKGWDYDVNQLYGWFYRPFGQTSVYLGKNVNDALATIGNIADCRE